MEDLIIATELRRKYNRMPLSDFLDVFEECTGVKVSDKERKDWECVGLSNSDFPSMEGFLGGLLTFKKEHIFVSVRLDSRGGVGHVCDPSGFRCYTNIPLVESEKKELAKNKLVISEGSPLHKRYKEMITWFTGFGACVTLDIFFYRRGDSLHVDRALLGNKILLCNDQLRKPY